MTGRSLLVVAGTLLLGGCAPAAWTQLRTVVQPRSQYDEIVRVTNAGELRAIRIGVSHGRGAIRELTVRYASGRRYSLPDATIEWTMPLELYIPRGDMAEISMIYAGDVLWSPGVGAWRGTLTISGAR